MDLSLSDAIDDGCDTNRGNLAMDADDWEASYADEVKLTKQELEELEDACAHTPDSSPESESEPSTVPKLCLWRAQISHQAATSLGFEWDSGLAASPNRDVRAGATGPVVVVSACSGCSAEAAVFKAWDLGVKHIIPIFYGKTVRL